MSRKSKTTAEQIEPVEPVEQVEVTEQVEQVEQIIEIETTPKEPTLDELMTQFKTKSAVIRHLHAQGWSRAKIAKFMGILYQHVRNVLTQPVKTKKTEETETVETETETEE